MSLMKGKKGLIMEENERSIAWEFHKNYLKLSLADYLGDALKKRVIPLVKEFKYYI